jgi:hypothetical protein
VTEHNLASALAAEREAQEAYTGLVYSAKSAATGRPHYFGRLYEDSDTCVFCGNLREHDWHLDRGAA